MKIKQEILKAFRDQPGQFISGEHLSQICQCTRTAVWKHIEELRQEGYQFEAVRKSGYRLVSSPDSVSMEEILTGMKTERIGQSVITFETVRSTQIIAHETANSGAAEGTLVVADRQEGGRGRLGRPWHSPKGAGIWMSLIIRPDIPLPRAPQMTLLTAVAMAKAIELEAGIKPQIKWPNDIFVGGKKVCGILTEMNAEADRINYLVIGIGLNVNTQPQDIPPELTEIATSLRIETGISFRRAALIQVFCQQFERIYDQYLAEGFAQVKAEWEAYSMSLGRVVTVRTPHYTIQGKAIGLGTDGVLIVEDAEGKQHKVYSADVE
ncbi:biotin--[acetyl-CoA-carboxylase] ligase [Brevibacillus sp. B_LB10_24]|uniref:biotin--[acetyl-CoA-carboxylase] ligase n=1 Tax=Brevibacillus sp. B_LB10_24 TaxID=3380645 RepID=UPI0038B6C05C